jgi:hypothetical protein
VPLEIGEAPPGGFTDQVPEAEQTEQLQFTSADAMDLCGSDLTWGDETMGACLAPGGDYYYIWTNSNEVYRVPVNSRDANQLGFIQAVIARDDAKGNVQKGLRSGGWKVAGLLVTLLGLAPACVFATLVGCLLDLAGVLVTGGLVADLGNDLSTDILSFQSHSRQADYYLCQMKGVSDSQCRVSSGITPDDLGEADE